MKRISFVVIFFALLVAAYAGINIPSGGQTSVTVGGSVTELDDKAAAIELHYDFQQQIVNIRFREGSIAGATFTPGQLGKFRQFTISWLDGKVYDDTGNNVGTLSAGQLTTLQNLAKSQRNSAEQFVVNNNLVPGTQTPW